MHRLINRLGRASIVRPWRTVTAWALVAIVVVGLGATAGGTFLDDLAAPGSQSERAMDLLDERFPEATAAGAMAVFAFDGDLVDHRDVIATTVANLATVDHVAAVSDPFAAGTVAPGGDIAYAQIVFDVGAAELGPEPFDSLDELLAPARDAGLTAVLGGDAVFMNAEAETGGAEAVGLLMALAVLLVAFGTVVAAVVPIGLALVAVAIGVSGISVVANVMDVSSSAPTVAAMIGLGVGIDYALFVVARYRENRDDLATPDAVLAAVGTSGTAVVFAGGTVVVSMAALALTGLGVLASIGLATALVVLVAAATAVTLLPAVLVLLGDRIERGRVGRTRHAGAGSGRWWRFGHRVAARPWPYLVAATLALVVLAVPALSMETRFPDAGDDPTTTSHRQAYDLLAEGFGEGFNGPLLVVADLDVWTPTGDPGTVLANAVGADPGVAAVAPAISSRAGDTLVMSAIPTTGPGDQATSATIARLRGSLPGGVHVSGITAMSDDLTGQLNDTLPIFVLGVLAASFLLLLVVFRSVVVPAKAVLMNLLSIGGAYGVLVAVFQWGWLRDVVGLQGPVAIASPIPVIMFGILFGLSMDYEVFLLSRIREEYDRTGDNAESVARGLAATGPVITSAALIMVAVFGSFVANPTPAVKMFGLGLATAIALDATIVRLLVVPAGMALLGRANWWLPTALARRLPRVTPEVAPRAVAVRSQP